MSRVIDAIFEKGVFRPLQDVKLKEHEKVSIKVISRDEWHRRFDRIIEKIHKKSSRFTPEEIEADISRSIKEVRAEKSGR